MRGLRLRFAHLLQHLLGLFFRKQPIDRQVSRFETVNEQPIGVEDGSLLRSECHNELIERSTTDFLGDQ